MKGTMGQGLRVDRGDSKGNANREAIWGDGKKRWD